ncbi:hypothetical protein KFE25_001572 [Diacronema lutheri]|uniref:Uncharacterized protein n=2 Tax=Diacronema lutheri TaxID=2081491 RepID=A0A8J5X888_DIALT|nr:hypothetical protein KFE25_001572 [Diacronema lutheri]
MGARGRKRSAPRADEAEEEEAPSDEIVLTIARGASVAFLGSVRARVLSGSATVLGAVLVASGAAFDLHSPAGGAVLALEAGDAQELVVHLRRLVAAPSDDAGAAHHAGGASPSAAAPRISTRGLPAAQLASALEAHLALQLVDGAGVETRMGALLPSQWSRAATSVLGRLRERPVVLLCGPRNSGKSTCLRLLCNRALEDWDTVCVLDCDLGQPELNPPGLVALHALTEPLLAPPHAHDPRSRPPALSAFFLGDASAGSDPALFVAAISALVRAHAASAHASAPLFVNTCGWVRGLGLALLAETVHAVRPSQIVELCARAPDRRAARPAGAGARARAGARAVAADDEQLDGDGDGDGGGGGGGDGGGGARGEDDGDEGGGGGDGDGGGEVGDEAVPAGNEAGGRHGACARLDMAELGVGEAFGLLPCVHALPALGGAEQGGAQGGAPAHALGVPSGGAGVSAPELRAWQLMAYFAATPFAPTDGASAAHADGAGAGAVLSAGHTGAERRAAGARGASAGAARWRSAASWRRLAVALAAAPCAVVPFASVRLAVVGSHVAASELLWALNASLVGLCIDAREGLVPVRLSASLSALDVPDGAPRCARRSGSSGRTPDGAHVEREAEPLRAGAPTDGEAGRTVGVAHSADGADGADGASAPAGAREAHAARVDLAVLAQPPRVECVGLGIVRAVDVCKGELHILTPVPFDALQRVNTIVRGALQLPAAIMIGGAQPMAAMPYLTAESVTDAAAGAARMRSRNNLARATTAR